MQITSFKQYEADYKKSVDNPEQFWGEIAQNFQWRKPWYKVLTWDFKTPTIKWFEGAKLNITENCLDRHLINNGDKAAIIWEPNDPSQDSVTLTYKMLHESVCRFANILKRNGAKKGDRICIYMPMVPELAIAVLACARIGAVHSVVFGGFSAKSIADRINDATCKLVITADGAYRGNKQIPLKDVIDDALIGCPTVEKCIVLTHVRTPVSMLKGRDVWWEDEVKHVNAICDAEEMDAEDLLFILYTSGSTGKPKGVVHTCGGYMVYAGYTFSNVFNYQPGEVYFCTADIGWITGHSYIVYGPLSQGEFDNTSPIEGFTYSGSNGPYKSATARAEDETFVRFKGIQLQKEFYLSDYKNELEPAFFSTIYWNYGLILTNKKETTVSFYTSDITGKFRIVVQGITNKDVIYGEHFFEVIPKQQ